MRDLAEATGEFDLATTGGLPEIQGGASGDTAVVVIEPLDWTDDSPYDDPDQPILVRTATVKVTVLAIDEDPPACDEKAERLANLLANAWNGKPLGGLTYPDKTMFSTGRWLKVDGAERRVEMKFVYAYEVGGFRDFGTEE